MQLGAVSAATGGVALGFATAHNLTEDSSSVVPAAAESCPLTLVSKLTVCGKPWPPEDASGLAVVLDIRDS